MDAIWALAQKYNLRVIEDAAHATETRYRGARLGSAAASKSDAVAFSFYATKNMTTGEGGMVVTNDADLEQKMRSLCLHGINRDAWNRYKENGKWFYQVLYEGFKYNMSDIQAALGIHQLRKLDAFAARRREIVDLYRQELADVEQIELPMDCTDGQHAWHLFVLRLKLEELAIDRAEFMEALSQSGVGASVHFIPIPMHPYFEPWAHLPENQVPLAMELYQQIVSLPLYPALTDAQVKDVCARVKQVIADALPQRKFAAAASGAEA
jgi:dTDP-4-amino-4,6-dideoxygalactose transaminase